MFYTFSDKIFIDDYLHDFSFNIKTNNSLHFFFVCWIYSSILRLYRFFLVFYFLHINGLLCGKYSVRAFNLMFYFVSLIK